MPKHNHDSRYLQCKINYDFKGISAHKSDSIILSLGALFAALSTGPITKSLLIHCLLHTPISTGCLVYYAPISIRKYLQGNFLMGYLKQLLFVILKYLRSIITINVPSTNILSGVQEKLNVFSKYNT